MIHNILNGLKALVGGTGVLLAVYFLQLHNAWDAVVAGGVIFLAMFIGFHIVDSLCAWVYTLWGLRKGKETE